MIYKRWPQFLTILTKKNKKLKDKNQKPHYLKKTKLKVFKCLFMLQSANKPLISMSSFTF